MLEPQQQACPPAYDWCDDPLTPDVDGTVVRIWHDVDSVLVYVRSDDDSCGIAAYTACDLLHMVMLAHDQDDAGVAGSSAPAAPHADKAHVHAVTAPRQNHFTGAVDFAF